MHANQTLPRKILALGVLFFICLLYFSAAALAREQAPQDLGEMREWRLTADRIDADRETQIVEAFGDVRLTSGEDYLEADYAKYYHDTDWVELQGNVEARWNRDHLTAAEASFDLRNQIGWLRNGTIFVAEPHLYFTGEDIQKISEDTYSFRKATITACDTDPPAWSLSAEEGAITVEGYAKLKHTKFRIKDQPVLYSPFLFIPAKRSRQSGLLFPEVGTSSRLGFYINQPVYWAVNDESDVTFYEYYMSRRGLMQGAEYRHTHDPETKGVWKFDWFYDRRTADTEFDEDGQFDDDDLTRPNHVRYWWRSKMDAHLPDPDWELKVDVDYVSDQNYLREFNSGLSGYGVSREMFMEEFHRDIQPVDELERTSSAVVFRSWDDYGFAARADYNQNLAHMNGNRAEDKNNSVQTLPEVSGYKYKDKLFTGPLEFEMDAAASNFMRTHGTSGGRLDVRPRLSLPLEFESVSIIPEVQFRETIYAVDVWGNRTKSAHDDDFSTRELPGFSTAAFTGFYKVYEVDEGEDLSLTADNAGAGAWTRIKHSVQPRVEYDWRPFVSQSEKPEFDAADRLDPVNELTYSLTNVLDRRKETVVLNGPKDEAKPRLAVDYLEFLRVRLQQSYDLREASRNEDRDEYPRRPFSDIMLEAKASPDKYISLTSRTLWSPYLGDVTEHDHFVRLKWPDRGHVDFGLDFVEEVDEFKRRRNERLRIMRTALELVLSDRWSSGFVYRSNLVTDTDLEKTLFAEYRHQCFSFRVSYTQTPYEDRIEANVNLVGINF
jgi:LPS-assembly protein